MPISLASVSIELQRLINSADGESMSIGLGIGGMASLSLSVDEGTIL